MVASPLFCLLVPGSIPGLGMGVDRIALLPVMSKWFGIYSKLYDTPLFQSGKSSHDRAVGERGTEAG